MITIITGPVNSGKSSRLVSLYNQSKAGDGFYNVRRYSPSGYIGQDIIRLSGKQSAPFSRTRDHIPDGWDEKYAYRNYSFSGVGMKFAEGIIGRVFRSGAPCYIDELGPLELTGLGLYPAVKKLTEADADLVLVVREDCLGDILKEFSIMKYKLYS